MKKLFLTMIVALMGTLLCAQPKIQFEKTTYDFGTIKEEGGKVTGKFIFKNQVVAVLQQTTQKLLSNQAKRALLKLLITLMVVQVDLTK